MLLIYTGNGKGKTSACLGQVIRALGHNLRVSFGQFMKRNGEAGEQKYLESILGDRFCAFGIGFFHKKEMYFAHREKALLTLDWAKEQLQLGCDLLILDESIYALLDKLILQSELENILQLCNLRNCHLILSGRGAPQWLLDKADLVSEIGEIKHPFKSGIKALAGIDF